jgi:hypothetical protein
MAMTFIANNPANNLLANYPNGIGTLITAQFVACDPLNGNYFTATNRDLVTFICLPASAAPAWNSSTTYTQGQVINVPVGSPPVQTAYIALANVGTNQNQNPISSPTFWALYTGSTLNVTSAPDSCTGRTANIVGYAVPVFDSTRQAIEFLVTPSSTFTLANGQVQFQASSNLVYVYVRNL